MAIAKNTASRGVRLWNNQPLSGTRNGISRFLTATSNDLTTPRIRSAPTKDRNFPSAYPTLSELQKYPGQSHISLQKNKAERPTISHNQTQFDMLINAITQSLTTDARISLPSLHNILRSYTSNANHWSKYAHRNPTKQYTRNLVFSVPGIFNLLLLVWTPGQKSPIHDHADAHCLMKVLKGSIRETRFAMPERPGEQGPLIMTSTKNFDLNKVSYMADSLGLHSISNPHPTEYAVSLHLYAPPHAALRGCNVFDENNGAATHVSQNAYDSVEGIVVARKP